MTKRCAGAKQDSIDGAVGERDRFVLDSFEVCASFAQNA
jgi:hypothetical protein